MSKKYWFSTRRYQPPYKEIEACGICGAPGVWWHLDTLADEWVLMDKDGKHRCKHEELRERREPDY